MPAQKLAKSPEQVLPVYMQLKDFLTKSSLSYTSFRRLRAEGKAPKEHKLSAKVILILKADAEKWLKNPPTRSVVKKKPKRPTAKLQQQQ